MIGGVVDGEEHNWMFLQRVNATENVWCGPHRANIAVEKNFQFSASKNLCMGHLWGVLKFFSRTMKKKACQDGYRRIVRDVG